MLHSATSPIPCRPFLVKISFAYVFSCFQSAYALLVTDGSLFCLLFHASRPPHSYPRTRALYDILVPFAEAELPVYWPYRLVSHN
jgi:hypothetical protein